MEDNPGQLRFGHILAVVEIAIGGYLAAWAVKALLWRLTEEYSSYAPLYFYGTIYFIMFMSLQLLLAGLFYFRRPRIHWVLTQSFGICASVVCAYIIGAMGLYVIDKGVIRVARAVFSTSYLMADLGGFLLIFLIIVFQVILFRGKYLDVRPGLTERIIAITAGFINVILLGLAVS